MARILVVNASLTGSTESMAETIVEQIKKQNHEVILKSFDFDPVDAQEMKYFDGILIGSYSWDDGIPYEIDNFYEDLNNVDLSGKLIGVFGSCDSMYETYGPALDIIASKVQEQNGVVYEERLKIELFPEEADIKHCQRFADEFLKELVK